MARRYDFDRHHSIGEGIYRLQTRNNPEFPAGAFHELLNCVYERTSEEPEKMRGYTMVGTAQAGGAISGVFDYDQGTKIIVSSVDGKIYETSGTSNLAQITGGTGFSTTASLRWAAAMFYGQTSGQQLLVLSNEVNVPQKYDGSTISTLGGSPPSTGKYPVTWAGRVWLFSGDTAYGSVVNDAEDWSVGNGAVQFQIEGGSGEITGAASFMGSLFIFKDRKTFRLTPGSTLASASVRLASGRIGCTSHHTIRETGGEKIDRLTFLSSNGVRTCYPTSRQGGFGFGELDEWVQPILSQRNKESDSTAWASFVEDRDEYSIQYPVGSLTTPSEGLIANTARQRGRPRWTRHNMNGMTAGGVIYLSGQETLFYGDSSGNFYKMNVDDTYTRNGTSYFSRMITPSFSQGRKGWMKRYGRWFIDLETNGNIPVNAYYLLGREALPTPISSNLPLVINDLGGNDGWGVGTWGSAKWGGSGRAGRYLRFTDMRRGYHAALRLDCGGAGHWMKLTGHDLEFVYGSHQVAA